jgi:hypothetical protein
LQHHWQAKNGRTLAKMKEVHCAVSLENQPGMKRLHQVVVPLMDPLMDWAQAASSFVRYAWECPIGSCAVFCVMAKTFWGSDFEFDSNNELEVGEG